MRSAPARSPSRPSAGHPLDQALGEAFNAALADFLGTEAHCELVAPFGFTADIAPDASADQLCADQSNIR